MNVLLTSQSGALGGAEARMVQEVHALRGLGWQVRVAAPDFPQADVWHQRLRDAGATLHRWNPYKFIEREQTGWFWRSLPALSRSGIRGQGFDLAHVVSTWTTEGMTRALELARQKIPFVLGLHVTYPSRTFKPELRALLDEALAGAVGAYAVSGMARRSFQEVHGPGCRHLDIQVVHNGIDTQAYAPDAEARATWRRRLGLAEGDCLLVWCGRLSAMKNPQRALELLALPQLRQPHIKLAMVGSGPELPALQRLARALRLGDQLLLPGQVPDTRGVLNAADAYLSTSKANEGFPLATSEALSCGLPVFVPDHPVFVECFGQAPAATLLPLSQLDRWADALRGLADAGEGGRAARREAARAYALAHLSQERMVSALQAFYAQL